MKRTVLPDIPETVEESSSDSETRQDEYPLPVAEDWDDLVARSSKMADVIDEHLDYESGLRDRKLRPMALCAEQKVDLISDLAAI